MPDESEGGSCCSFLPRMLLHRPPRGGNIAKTQLTRRFDDFASGHWPTLSRASAQCDEDGSIALQQKRRRLRPKDDVQRRAARASLWCKWGNCLQTDKPQKAPISPLGRRRRWHSYEIRTRDARFGRGSLLAESSEVQERSRSLTVRDDGGTSQTIVGERSRILFFLFELGFQLAKVETPLCIVDAIRLERLTALQQHAGRRRMCGPCVASHLGVGPSVYHCFNQWPWCFRSHFETGCVEALMSASALPFVRLFHGTLSAYLWEQDDGTVHTIEQGEGGEQGDALMRLLFALGQHAALSATARPRESD